MQSRWEGLGRRCMPSKVQIATRAFNNFQHILDIFRSAVGSKPDGGARPTLLAQNSHGSSDTAYGLWLSHIGGRRILVTERRGGRRDPIVCEQGAAEEVEQDFEAIKSAMCEQGSRRVDSGNCGKGSG